MSIEYFVYRVAVRYSGLIQSGFLHVWHEHRRQRFDVVRHTVCPETLRTKRTRENDWKQLNRKKHIHTHAHNVLLYEFITLRIIL